MGDTFRLGPDLLLARAPRNNISERTILSENLPEGRPGKEILTEPFANNLFHQQPGHRRARPCPSRDQGTRQLGPWIHRAVAVLSNPPRLNYPTQAPHNPCCAVWEQVENRPQAMRCCGVSETYLVVNRVQVIIADIYLPAPFTTEEARLNDSTPSTNNTPRQSS